MGSDGDDDSSGSDSQEEMILLVSINEDGVNSDGRDLSSDSDFDSVDDCEDDINNSKQYTAMQAISIDGGHMSDAIIELLIGDLVQMQRH